MSHSKHDRSLDELYGDFLRAHRALHGTVEAYQSVYLVKAQSELSRLENVIRILEDYKKKPVGDLSEKLKKAMNYQDLEKRLQEEKERADGAEKEALKTPYGLTFEEMNLLLRVFGHESGGILNLSQEVFFDELNKLSQSTREDEQNIVAKLGGKDKADEVIKNIINKINSASADTNWDGIKWRLSTGVKNVFEYKDNQQIYETTRSQKKKLDTEIEQLMNPKTAHSRVDALKQKKEELSSYILSLKSIKEVHDKYYTSFTFRPLSDSLKPDMKALETRIKKCHGDNERLARLKSYKRVLLSLQKNDNLIKAIEEIEKVSAKNIKSIETVLKELDEKYSVKEDLESNHDIELPKTQLEKNKQEIARLLAELDTLKVKGKIITKEERRKWEDIEQRIEELEYENDKLDPNRPQKSNEVTIQSLKEAVRMTISQSQSKSDKTKEKATQYFKNIKQIIQELRQEQDSETQENTRDLNN
ncbi:TPA: hypothetical protein ACTXXA_002920 [Legionella anisa]